MSNIDENLCTLDELGYVSRGRSQYRPRNAPHLYGGRYPFIQTADITKSRLYITSYSQTYTEAGLEQSRLWKPGVLCIANAGVNTGDNAILSFSSCFPDSIIGFEADQKKSDAKFVKYCLDSIKTQIKSITMGATQDNLSVSKLLTFKFPKIDLGNQKKIAAILSTYDDLIENNLHRIALLEKMAEEIYREWFVRFRFPGYQNTEFKKGIPKGWEEKPINSILDFKSGFAFKSEKYVEGGKYGVVTIKNVHDGKFISECTDSIDDLPSRLPKHCNILNGDILMSLTGNVGRVCMAVGENLLLNQRVAILKPNKQEHSSFIYWLFRQKSMMTFCEMISTGAAQQNLSPIKLGNQTVIYPTDDIIELYHEKIKAITEIILSRTKQILLLEETRRQLLPRLISGKLSVEDLDIQFPPSMLEDVAA